MRFNQTLLNLALLMIAVNVSFSSFAEINSDSNETKQHDLSRYSEEIREIQAQVRANMVTFKETDGYQRMKKQTVSVLSDNNATLFDNEEAKDEALVFVSMSMPREAVKQWMTEAAKLDVSINIRGLVAETLPKSILFIQKLIGENKNIGGLNIDPTLFDEYGIEKVPAVVLRRKNNTFDVVYGTSSISEALTVIKNEGSSS